MTYDGIQVMAKASSYLGAFSNSNCVWPYMKLIYCSSTSQNLNMCETSKCFHSKLIFKLFINDLPICPHLQTM